MAVVEFPVSLAARTDAGAALPRAVQKVRLYFLTVFALGLAAFILGVEGRYPGGLFLYPPPVDWIPPLSNGQWLAAFAVHQQDPIFAACGGSQSLTEFQTLYWWEWLRRASVLVLAAVAAVGLAGASALRQFRFALPRVLGLCLIVAACALARWLIGLAAANVEELARFNVGQYRHAVDVTLASAAVAAVLASALVPPRPRHPAGGRRFPLAAWLWGGALLIDVAFGALFMARDAAAVWTAWPGLGDVAPDRFVSYAPLWLNLVFNPYTIQLVHRALSMALWVLALAYVIRSTGRDPRGAARATVLFGLMTAQTAIGIAALVLGAPPALSILHRVGGVLLLAVAFTLAPSPARNPLPWRRRLPATPRMASPAS
ncbi:MAG TPA: COX15/CtaA family protein [Xanthobacteraceae bacterium]|nr:COX15/CtaA family protein [Xanthobacteraceae bacterium]